MLVCVIELVEVMNVDVIVSEVYKCVIVEFLLDGIIIIDWLGCVIEFNVVVEVIFGYWCD